MLGGLWGRIRTFPDLVVLFRRAARRFDVSSIAVWKRAVVLFSRYGFAPDETLESGFVDPRFSPIKDAGYIGKRRLMRHQRRFNPIQWECLVEDKVVFDAFCRGMDLPVPELYAVFDKGTGWSASHKVMNERAEWERFFEENLPQEFLIKPALGVYGRGINLYQRDGGAFRDFSGQVFSATSLYERLRSNSGYSKFLIQQRLRNHPDIERLTGTKFLQTVRMVTWAADVRDVEIYETTLKLILGNNLRDNYEGGRTGNAWVEIDRDSGVLEATVGPSSDGLGFKLLSTHPVTGLKLAGLVLPHWSAVRQLVERAARLFLPLRTIGWDVALTGQGPVLVEGNVWWDPANHPHVSEGRQRQMAQFMRRFTRSE